MTLVLGLAACTPPQATPSATSTGSPVPAFVPELSVSLDPATMDARYEAGLVLFEYDAAAALDLERTPNATLDGVVVEEVSYASPIGGTVPGYLVFPERGGFYPGLLLMHGSGGSRNDMLGEGQAYARLGVVVLLISAPAARTQPPGPFLTFTPADREQQIQLIVDLRRGVDVLVEVGADPDRIGYVGYSYGGAMGAQLAGVEHRIRAYVLDVADGGLVEHFTGSDDANGDLGRLTPDERVAWLAAMEPIEPLYFVRHAAPSALLFQSARRDQLVTREDSQRLHEHASDPKQVIWYDSDHMLPPQAWCDQAAWLRGHLGFSDAAFLPECD